MNLFNRDQQRQAAQSIFMKSVVGLANILAFVAALFGAPPLYQITHPYVVAYVRHYYGYELIPVFEICSGLLIFLLLFFAARMSISTLLVAGGIAFAVRFL